MFFSNDAFFGGLYDQTTLNRLDARFRVFMAPFKADLENRRVLDLASHEGRWSYAAASLGAAHVTGIEGRPDLVARSEHLFEQKRLRERATFIAGDIFDVLPRLRGQTFDVVLCLGIFYHVMDHYRLLKLIRDVGPSLIILDGTLIDDANPLISLTSERTDHFLNAIATEGEESAVVGCVSKGALELMANAIGFDVRYLDWDAAGIESRDGLADYFTGGPGERRRFSAVLRKR